MKNSFEPSNLTGLVLPAQVASAAARWDFPSFGGFDASAVADAEAEPPLPPLHTAAEIDEIERAAHAEGQARGQAEGYAAGYAAGQAEVREQAARLTQLLQHLSRPLATLDEEVERTLVALTVELAHRLVGEALLLDPAKVLGVVREAVAALGDAPRPLSIHLHPEDLSLLRAQAATGERAEEWLLVADTTLARGDCRVSGAHGQVDARLDTRAALLSQGVLGEPA